MARWALASLLDAIIFIDCTNKNKISINSSHRVASYLGDFLDVLDRPETQLNLAQDGHVPGIGGASTEGCRLGSGGAEDGTTSKHRGHGGGGFLRFDVQLLKAKFKH